MYKSRSSLFCASNGSDPKLRLQNGRDRTHQKSSPLVVISRNDSSSPIHHLRYVHVEECFLDVATGMEADTWNDLNLVPTLKEYNYRNRMVSKPFGPPCRASLHLESRSQTHGVLRFRCKLLCRGTPNSPCIRCTFPPYLIITHTHTLT